MCNVIERLLVALGLYLQLENVVLFFKLIVMLIMQQSFWHLPNCEACAGSPLHRNEQFSLACLFCSQYF